MAIIPSDVKSNINSLYDKRKQTELSQLASSQKKAVGNINSQKKETNQQFYDKRNQADTVNFQNRNALKEMMAASGLGRSGENISGQVGLQAARQNTLGGLKRDEQNILGGFNRQISDINDPSKKNSIVSEIESARSGALADALEKAIQRAEQQRQYNEQMKLQQEQFQEQQRQYNQRLAWEKEQFNRQMAEKQAAAARSAASSRGRSSSSRGSGKSTSKASGSQGKSLSDLYNDYSGSKTQLDGLQKRSSVPPRQRVKSIAEMLAEQKKKSSGGRGGMIRFQQ